MQRKEISVMTSSERRLQLKSVSEVTVPNIFDNLTLNELKTVLLEYLSSHLSAREEFELLIQKQATDKTPAGNRELVKHLFSKQLGKKERFHRADDPDWKAIFKGMDSMLTAARNQLNEGNEEAALAISIQFFDSLEENFDNSLLYEEGINVERTLEDASSIMRQALAGGRRVSQETRRWAKEVMSRFDESEIGDMFDRTE